jgi:addiction module HigA family antidote
MTTKVRPDFSIHPGEYLAEELDARGMTQRELSRRAGLPYRTVNLVVNGKKRITAEFALALEREWDVSAETWLNLQQSYDLSVARGS